MLDFLDSLTDGITMYRLLIYYLVGLLLAAIGLSAFGDLHYNPLFIALSALILAVVCWTTNKIFSYIFDAPTSSESSIITGLILALIITPNPTGYGLTFLLAASGLAMASKYLLTIRQKHIFNPAAIAVVLTALGPQQSATWWVSTAAMLPFVLIGGVLVTRKIHRGRMVISFFVATFVATIVYSLLTKAGVLSNLHNMILSSSVFFLGFVMLTEPLTSPPTATKQSWYGVLVGALLPPQVHLFSFYSTPELALIAGNVFSYIVSPKTKLFPILKQKIRVAANVLDFVFIPDRPLTYLPGQYMEWTLPHSWPDSRGNRRYLTLASSPTEPEVRIGVKFYENGSSFKKALLAINQNTPIVAAQLAGDFVLPKDPAQKLVFIAGGIGITPFRSMVKYLMDKNEQRSVTLLYSAKTAADIAYAEVFEAARQSIGLQTLYALTYEQNTEARANTHRGSITVELIKTTVPDYRQRTFYVSGTHAMVEAMQHSLKQLGVPRSRIKTDFFPGYA